MPKIIENLEEKLLCEARKQLQETGYSAMTIRSVAAGCGVGVGTVYNYFPSKDALLAASMLEDWQSCVAAVHGVSGSEQSPERVLRCIYDQLLGFIDRHQVLFRDKSRLLHPLPLCAAGSACPAPPAVLPGCVHLRIYRGSPADLDGSRKGFP